MSEGKAPSYQVKDKAKLERLMKEYNVESQIALAEAIMAEFGQAGGPHSVHSSRACKEGLNCGESLASILEASTGRSLRSCIAPTSAWTTITLHLILQGLRASLADGWGGSMIATELQDVDVRHAQPNVL